MRVVELAYPLRGRYLPADHGYQLFSALAHSGCKLHGLERVSLLRVRGRIHPRSRLLSLGRDAMLVLRLDLDYLPASVPQSGLKMQVGGLLVELGEPSLREIVPALNLESWMTFIKHAMTSEELLSKSRSEANNRGINAKIDLSKSMNGMPIRRTIRVRKKNLVGYALQATCSSESDSLRLQGYGIGGKRRFGCGVFTPARHR